MIEAWSRSEVRSSAGPWTCGEWGSCDLELDDSLDSDVQALSDGRGWVGDGKVDSTLVLYLRGTGTVGTRAGDTALVVAGGELCPVAGVQRKGAPEA